MPPARIYFAVAVHSSQLSSDALRDLVVNLRETNAELASLNEELDASTAALDEANAERTRLEAILRHLSEGIMVVDRHGVPQLTSAAYDHMLGCMMAGVLEDDERRPLSRDQLPLGRMRAHAPFHMTFSLRQPDNSRRWFEADGHPIFDDGIFDGGVITVRDVTEGTVRRQQEDLLAMCSHELRTPITALGLQLEMILRKLRPAPDDELPRKYAAFALRQARRLEVLAGDLLDVGRLQTGKLHLRVERVDLAELCPQTVETARRMTTRHVMTCSAPVPTIVRGDSARLEQIVANLLSNAIAYSPDATPIQTRVLVDGSYALIQVQDHGTGIASNDLPHIFTRFFQVDRPQRGARSGLGLGLYIAQEIAAAHGGRIDVVSAVGDGSTFTLRLPLATE
jgi:PAS domain S-box-containing protein